MWGGVQQGPEGLVGFNGLRRGVAQSHPLAVYVNGRWQLRAPICPVMGRAWMQAAKQSHTARYGAGCTAAMHHTGVDG